MNDPPIAIKGGLSSAIIAIILQFRNVSVVINDTVVIVLVPRFDHSWIFLVELGLVVGQRMNEELELRGVCGYDGIGQRLW
jgi:hypothetical protein